MFLQWIAKCELVPMSPDSHVLKKFSDKCQRTLCSMVVSFLNTENADLADVLPSGHHIRWSMEIIGHSFSLGLEDADVIAGAIRIYEKWLGVDSNAKIKDQRPACMHKVEQAFIQDLLGQMTLLFEERAETSRAQTDAVISKHVQLCGRVLEIFEAVAKRRGPQLSPQTWDRMIRLLLGAADGVLHGSRSVLGNHLCGSLVRILFELYLRSLVFCGPRGDTWNLLQKFYRRWIHRYLVIEQWNAVTLALTRSMMRHLRTKDMSKDVEIVWAESRLKSKFEIETSLVAYAWYRLLRIVGHPTGFNDPDVYLSAIKGASRLADEFTHVGKNQAVEWEQVLGALTSNLRDRNDETEAMAMLMHSPVGSDNGKSNEMMVTPRGGRHNGKSSVPRLRAPPDVNTILRLLGPWLFDACLSRGPRFALCRSEALRCLGKLICGFAGGRSKRIHWAYAIRSLMALQGALLEDDDRLVASAVYNWSRVFGLYGDHTLRGAAVVTGSFHRAVEQMFRVTERSASEEQSIGGIPLVLLRRACVEACSSMLTLHTHLPRTLTTDAEESIVASSMSGLAGLLSSLPSYTSSQVVALLMNAIKAENDPTNQQMILWLLTVAIQQEASFWSNGSASSRTSQVPVTILLICSMITKSGRYKAPVMLTAFECLRHLSLVWHELYHHAMNSVVHLVNACCDFITASVPVLRSNRAPFFLEELMCASYRCMTEWVAAAPLLLSRPQVVKKIISSVLDTNDRSGAMAAQSGVTTSVRESSQKLLNMLMKHHATQADSDTVQLNEKGVLAEICDKKKGDASLECRFFAVNKTSILTVIEKPATQAAPSPETVIILRDASGRYVWRTKSRFRDGPRLVSTADYEMYSEDRSHSSSNVSMFKADEDEEAYKDVDGSSAMDGEAVQDPLLQALRVTHESSKLMSWQSSPPGSGTPATTSPTSSTSSASSGHVKAGEGNTGLSSVSERKALALGGDVRELEDNIFGDLLREQTRADSDTTAATGVLSASGASDLRCEAPQQPTKDPALQSWEMSRRMMTELGFLSVRNWGSVFAMKSSSGDLLRELEDLDKLPTREAFEFAVAYATSRGSEGGYDNVHIVGRADTENGSVTVSPEYESFLACLGERVPLTGGEDEGAEDNAGYYAGEAMLAFSGDIVYHASYGGDVCFYVPTLPVKSLLTGGYVEPTDLLSHANLLIVWNESQLNYRPGNGLWDSTFHLPKPSSHVVIIIDPLGNDLFCVRICHEGSPLFDQHDVITREDDTYVDEGEVHCARVLGPLQDGMVVNAAWLAPLVRQTAINAAMISRSFQRYQHKAGASSHAPEDGPDWKRERMITSIIENYMRPQLPGEFYGGLFMDVANYAKEEDAVIIQHGMMSSDDDGGYNSFSDSDA